MDQQEVAGEIGEGKEDGKRIEIYCTHVSKCQPSVEEYL